MSDAKTHQCDSWQMLELAEGGWRCGVCGKHEQQEMTAAEKAMQDIQALLDGYSKEWRREIDVVMDLHRIVGAYSVERIGEK